MMGLTTPTVSLYHQPMTTTQHGTNGRIYFVDERGHATLARCTWLVEVASGDPEPSCPADTVKIVECGAKLTRLDDDGWTCADGHEHLAYGSAAQQAQERAEAQWETTAAWWGVDPDQSVEDFDRAAR